MKKITLLLFFTLNAICIVLACGNEYEESTPFRPKTHYTGRSEKSPYVFDQGFDTTFLHDRQISLQTMYMQQPSFRLQSDIALIELKIGDRQKAVKILEELYAAYPQEYNIVANLGTAYEVIGENAKAYELLQKAVALKPNSHYGSEWIHLKILEAKIQRKDLASILQLKQVPSLTEYALELSEEERHRFQLLKLMLTYQLTERIAFIPPKDKIVGRLLIDLADLSILTGERKEIERYFNQALLYDPSLQTLIDERKADLSNAGRMSFIKKYWTGAVYLLGLAVTGGFLLYQKRKVEE